MVLEIRSKVEEAILSYFFINEEEKLYLRQIATRLGLDPSNTSKKMKELTKKEIFLSEQKGLQKYYYLNLRYPFFQELKNLVRKNYGLELDLKEVKKKIVSVETIYIFGSYLTDHFDQKSDIDLLCVGDFDALTLSGELSKLEKKYGREINAVEMDTKEFQTRQKKRDQFLSNILKNKIEI
ncbi:hypothetical protein AUJ78_00670 [Candidatus Peregrinibacteria bacterium CG1_02_41_10]|nr:MAG: hypothetical protein AUJ78_00670 [Candidatus Peregrinibacteria bacterium CG1_02_41_10]